MKKHEIIFSLLKIPFDFCIIFFAFFIARDIRGINDFVWSVQLPSHTISNENLFLFALYGAILYLIIFFIHGLYTLSLTSSKLKEVFDIIRYSIYWFVFFSMFVYFWKWVWYEIEIPRLIILFSTILWIIWVNFERILLNKLQTYLLNIWKLSPRNILLITKQSDHKIKNILTDLANAHIYKIVGYINAKKINSNLIYIWSIENLVDILEQNHIDEILYIDSDFNQEQLYEIWDISRIYGVKYRYITNGFDITKTNTTISLLHKIPVLEIKTTALGSWWRVIKRGFDLGVSSILLILSFPFFVIIGILIKLEDKAGPIIYKNPRVGQNGKIFHLYKFRYLKWKYCIKDGYGVKNEEDEALKYEKELIEKKSTRKWPLYKIQNDPRKTKIGAFLEKYSIDELPQLLNVLLWDMSLIGPRPHQPREVQNYLLSQKRVLTIKPGITWLAQVNGREQNSFDKEVNLDIFYIENWSFLLDIKILFKTPWILFNRK